MTYYQDKKKAFIDLQRIIHERKKVDLVTLYGVMLRKYGYGKSAVDNLAKYLEEEGVIEIKDCVVNYLLDQKKEEKKNELTDGETDILQTKNN